MNRKWIPLAMIGSGVLVTVDSVFVAKTFPPPSRFVSLLFVFIVLSFLGEAAPEIAAALAVLFFLSLLLARGDKVFGLINSKLGKGK